MYRAVPVVLFSLIVTGCGGTHDWGPAPLSRIAEPNKQDVEINRGVRRALLQEKSLSENVSNIHVRSIGGTVLLQGAVSNGQERERVLQIAREIAGVAIIKDKLEVLTKAVASKDAEPLR